MQWNKCQKHCKLYII